MKYMRIAIDGPSASGKGTIAEALSRKFGLHYLNTGKIYRVVAFVARRISGESGSDLLTEARGAALKISHYWGGAYDLRDLFSEENSKVTSTLSQDPDLRAFLLEFQRDFIKKGKVILEGRDIGTVIMPDADVKFYLDATPEVRAKRRCLQLFGELRQADYERILFALKQRDYNDTHREVGALKRAEDAIYLDASELSVEETVARLSEFIEKAMNKKL